jgi:hypothetical protein
MAMGMQGLIRMKEGVWYFDPFCCSNIKKFGECEGLDYAPANSPAFADQ